jgi:hypothetical protein
MVHWMRTANIKGGKFMEALGWAKEMAAFGEKAFGTGKIRVFLDSFGDVSTIRWVIEYPDLATCEKAMEKVLTDADYWKRVNQAFAAGLFVDGATRDVVMREV